MKLGPYTQSFPTEYQYGDHKFTEIDVKDKLHGKDARQHPAIAGLQNAKVYVK